MRRVSAGIAAACALFLCACPGGGGTGEPEPPSFNATNVSPLAEPPPPAAGKEGLAYLEATYPKLREPWVSFVNDCRLRLAAGHELNRTDLRAVVDLQIRRDGSLLEAEVTEPSGQADFDRVALEITRDAAPYPSPPSDLLSDDGLLHLRWGFHRDQRLAGVATADVRRVTWPPDRAIPAFIAAGSIEQAAGRLAKELASGDPAGLMGMGEAVAAASIQAALASEDPATLAAGVDAAARAKLAAAAPALQALARSITDADLRRSAIAALGAIGAQGSRSLLLDIVSGKAPSDGSATVAAAMDALDAMGASADARAALAARLSSDPKEQRLVLAVAAKVALPGAIDDLRALTSKGPRAFRAAACTALGTAASASGEKGAAHKTIRKHLTDRDASLRAACARGAGNAGGKSRLTYWKLVGLFKDRDERVRAEALRAAAVLEPARFTNEIYILRKDKSPVVLAALADALAVGATKDTMARLTALAASEHPQVRRAVAAALAVRKEPEARKALAAMITDADVEVRLLAVGAVESSELGPILESDNQQLRIAALTRHFAAAGRAGSLADMVGRLVTAEDVASRARVAGAWLAH